MYPLNLLVDRNEVDEVSTASHLDLGGKSGIFIYEGHKGEVEYSEKGYDLIEQILEDTLKAIESCPCENGCPSFIQSPKCGNNNEPLDKHAAIMTLTKLWEKSLISHLRKKKRTLPKSKL